jgi:hypothetical protein
MSNVVLNRGNVDITDLSIQQAGSPSCEITTEQPLLDGTKDYVMGVTSCVVPLTEEPMMTYDVNVAGLFTVQRRKHGAVAGTTALGLGGVETCTLEAGYKIFSVTDLVTFLANWSAQFSAAVSDIGFTVGAGVVDVNVIVAANDASIDRRHNNNTGTRLLGFSLTPGGTLEIVGSPRFWNNFFIEPNSYCKEILGFSADQLCFSNNALNQVNNDAANLFAGGVVAVQANPFPLNSPQLSIRADYSIYRKTEERMLISMEVALNIPMNISVVNGTETRTHTVFSAPLQSEIITTLSSSDGHLRDTTSLSTTLHQGRVHLLKKTNGSVQWYPMQSSYAIQNSRCELYMTRRRFARETGKWYTDRQQFKIHSDGVWNASLKFVSVF